MTVRVPTLNVVAQSEDNDWYAFPADWTRREVASELAHNLVDWWLDEYVWFDDDDKPHGWVTAYRALFNRIERGWVNYEPRYDGTDWWMESTEGWPSSESAWIVKL